MKTLEHVVCLKGATSCRTWKPPDSHLRALTRSRFNGATSCRTWKHDRDSGGSGSDSSASMGPRPVGRGNLPVRAQPVPILTASMGPRPVGRGNWLAARSISARPAVASMGPRPVGRGNRCNRCSMRSGHLPLQWGHVLSDVETTPTLYSPATGRPAFNGATSRWRWKRGGGRGRQVQIRFASMGPRPVGRGNANVDGVPDNEEYSFNGATSCRTWKRTRRYSGG